MKHIKDVMDEIKRKNLTDNEKHKAGKEVGQKETDTTKNQKIDTLEPSLLPEKDLFRVNEVAAYFGVSERTIYLWIQHGHLQETEKAVGTRQIPRESILKCRLGARVKATREAQAPRENN